MRPILGLRSNLWGAPVSQRHYVIEGKTLKEERLISEGAFAFVYHVKDVYTSESYALKKIICQESDRLFMAKHEIQIMESIPPHQNLVKYYGSAQIKTDKANEILILLELCEGGHLLNLLDKTDGKIGEEAIVSIMNDILRGTEHLHTLPKPVAHRDLKVENILFDSRGQLKICDFGSASTNFIDTMTCSKEELLLERASIEQYTTMLYRAPEMIDLQRDDKITVNMDIWMIGCILFILAFYKHPFQDANSLAITNAKFDIPMNHGYSKKLTDLIIWMLSIKPLDRPSSTTLVEIFSNYPQLETIPMPENIQNKCKDYYNTAQNNYNMVNKPYTPLDPALLKRAKIRQKVPSKIIKNQTPEASKPPPSPASIDKASNVFDVANPDNQDLAELLNSNSLTEFKDNIGNQSFANWDPFSNNSDSKIQNWDPFNDARQSTSIAHAEFNPFISSSEPYAKEIEPFLNDSLDDNKHADPPLTNKYFENTSFEKIDPFETMKDFTQPSKQEPQSPSFRDANPYTPISEDPFWDFNSTKLDMNPNPIHNPLVTNNGYQNNFNSNDFIDSSYFLSDSPLSKPQSSPSSNAASSASVKSVSKTPLIDNKEHFNLDDCISSLIEATIDDTNFKPKTQNYT